MDKMKQITKDTLIPISLAISIFAGALWLGSVSNQVSEIKHKDSPSRAEYNQITTQLIEIQKGISEINIYLRNNK